jgi:LAS superfamily LD-carboxypeptidase LdcB
MGEKKQLAPLLVAIVLLCGVLYAVHPDGLMSWLPDYLDSLEQPPVSRPTDPSDPVNPTDPVDPADPVDPVDPADPIDPIDPPSTPSTPVTPPDPPITDDPPVTPDPPAPPYRYSSDVSAYLDAIFTVYDDVLLVNKSHPLGASYVPSDLVILDYELTNGRKLVQLDRTAADALTAMMLCMRADGIDDVFVTSGYRSYNNQKQLQNHYVEQEQAKAKAKGESISRAEALEIVRTYSAEEGKSEHQSGLCIDFITTGMHNELDNAFEDYEAFDWLQENACQFGFILRYPKDKVNITEYSYESWHYRFVGRDLALAITASGLTLEEYLAR